MSTFLKKTKKRNLNRSPDPKKSRGLRSINQEDSARLSVDNNGQNDSLSRIGNNTSAIMTPTKNVTFDPFATETRNTPLKTTQNRNLSYSYPYTHSGNTRVISPSRTNRSSHNEVGPVQKLNSILRRLEKVLESLLT